jgi:hypothetical protein
MDIPINYLAIAVATVAAMLVGWLWYGPIFGKPWKRLAGEPVTKAVVIYPITLVATFVTGYVIAYVTGVTSIALGNGYIVPALFTAFFLWLGFSAARSLIVALFEAKPIKLWLINTGHDLAVALVIATIIGLMGV